MIGTELEITPAPTPDELAAITAALSTLLVGAKPTPSPWWEAGVREALEDDPTSLPDGFGAAQEQPARSRFPTPR